MASRGGFQPLDLSLENEGDSPDLRKLGKLFLSLEPPFVSTLQDFANSIIVPSKLLADNLQAFRHATQDLVQFLQPVFTPVIFHAPFPFDPTVEAMLKASQGDRDAAQYLAGCIKWHPTGWQAKAATERARLEGKSREQLVSEYLTQAMLLCLGSSRNPLPLMLADAPYLRTRRGKLVTERPLHWTPRRVWRWLKQECVRAASTQLAQLPYAPTVVLNSAPIPGEEFDFAAFAPIATSGDGLRGRPVGTGNFKAREDFLASMRRAGETLRSQDHRITQERVAELLSLWGLAGGEDPVRQLQRWRRLYGFGSWSDLVQNL